MPPSHLESAIGVSSREPLSKWFDVVHQLPVTSRRRGSFGRTCAGKAGRDDYGPRGRLFGATQMQWVRSPAPLWERCLFRWASCLWWWAAPKQINVRFARPQAS